VINKAIEEGVVKKSMDININDFDIQDTYLAFYTEACGCCKKGEDCIKHPYVK